MNAKRLTVQRVMTTLVLLVSALLGWNPSIRSLCLRRSSTQTAPGGASGSRPI
jgi:hypothetical protein